MCTWKKVGGMLLLGAMHQVCSLRKEGASELFLSRRKLLDVTLSGRGSPRGRGLEMVVRIGTGSALGQLTQFGYMRGLSYAPL